MKKYLFTLVIVLLFIIFLSHHLVDGEKLLSLLIVAKWWYLLLALVLQAVYYSFYTLLYQESLKIYDISWKFKKVFLLLLASISAGIVTPLGSIAGTAVFVHRAKKEDRSRFSAGSGLFVSVLFDFLILFLFLTLSLLFLFFKHDIYKYEITGYALFTCLLFGIISIVILGIYKPNFLEKIIKLFHKITNKFGKLIKHREYFGDEWIDEKSTQIKEISSRLVESKDKIKLLFSYSLFMHTANMISLFILFLAFGHMVNIAYLFIGYSLGRLFLVISPTPQGIGIVDSLMPIIFNSLGIDIQLAILVTLAYRGLSLWLPALLGFGALHKVVVLD